MQNYKYSPSELISSLWINRRLIYALTKREVAGRYKGSIFGLFWPLLNPILMLIVYVFVFSLVFKTTWALESGSKLEFAMILFPGLLLFSLFSECITRSPSLIINNANYVKKVIFPLEILPWVLLGAALFHFALGLIVWLAGRFLLIGPPSLNVLLLPIFITPFLLFCVGLMWILAALGVYVRDVGQVVNILTSALMFVSPIFFPASALPLQFQSYLYLNPLTFPIESIRNILMFGLLPNATSLAMYWIFSIAVALLGFIWFQKTRKGFADVL